MISHITFKDIAAFFHTEKKVFVRLIVCMACGACGTESVDKIIGRLSGGEFPSLSEAILTEDFISATC